MHIGNGIYKSDAQNMFSMSDSRITDASTIIGVSSRCIISSLVEYPVGTGMLTSSWWSRRRYRRECFVIVTGAVRDCCCCCCCCTGLLGKCDTTPWTVPDSEMEKGLEIKRLIELSMRIEMGVTQQGEFQFVKKHSVHRRVVRGIQSLRIGRSKEKENNYIRANHFLGDFSSGRGIKHLHTEMKAW